MQAIIFYLSYPFILLVAYMPFPLFYAFSDLFYFILYILVGYRTKVVRENLKNSFPGKTTNELKQIERKYYRYLCDLMLETLRTISMTEKDYAKRVVMRNTELMQKLFDERGSVVLVMGHYGNWEWTGPAIAINTPFQLNVIYRPLSNQYFERMIYKMRTKFGTKITPVNNVLRELVSSRHIKTAIGIIADQTPLPETAYWTSFLNQDTPVYEGTEKIAKKFNYPVVFINVTRKGRGYYEIKPEILSLEPGKSADGEITELHTRKLERQIQQTPELWLWSHRRWKHKRKLSV